MPTVQNKTISYNVFNLKGEKIAQEELVDPQINNLNIPEILAQTVRVYLTNQRQGTASVKSRGQVSGSTKKIYRQKGTGRARHGDIKAPIFIGGGKVFGPQPREFQLNLNKKIKKKAFLAGIVDKINNNQLIAITDLAGVNNKTKDFYSLLKKIYPDKLINNKFLLVSGGSKNLLLSCRNIPNLTYSSVDCVNTYEVLTHKNIIVEKEVLDKLFKRMGVLTAKAKKTITRRSKKIKS